MAAPHRTLVRLEHAIGSHVRLTDDVGVGRCQLGYRYPRQLVRDRRALGSLIANVSVVAKCNEVAWVCAAGNRLSVCQTCGQAITGQFIQSTSRIRQQHLALEWAVQATKGSALCRRFLTQTDRKPARQSPSYHHADLNLPERERVKPSHQLKYAFSRAPWLSRSLSSQLDHGLNASQRRDRPLRVGVTSRISRRFGQVDSRHGAVIDHLWCIRAQAARRGEAERNDMS